MFVSRCAFPGGSLKYILTYLLSSSRSSVQPSRRRRTDAEAPLLQTKSTTSGRIRRHRIKVKLSSTETSFYEECRKQPIVGICRNPASESDKKILPQSAIIHKVSLFVRNRSARDIFTEDYWIGLRYVCDCAISWIGIPIVYLSSVFCSICVFGNNYVAPC